MEKTYKPAAIEAHWYQRWEARDFFVPSGDNSKPSYCIMLPPPNITGSLHMGHAFQQTLMDILIRHQRMRGADVLWQGGTDHAGIATQMVVERQLERRGESRAELGRDAFVRAVWRWKQESGGAITRQSRRMGSSLDWSRERFTMDQGLSAAVRKVFVQLYDEGLIYRGTRLVNWDPVLRTAISDLEVKAEEVTGSLWHIRYPLAAGGGHVVVATTRPETLLGDVAVAVHPEDERHRSLLGKELELPLCDRRIPVIADQGVDPAFGTGCVKITPAHDFNDYKVGRAHGLPLLNILTADAKINEAAPRAYRGLDRYAARRRIVAELAAAGLLERTESHRHVVPRGDRSNTIIEPWLTKQWYVRVDSLAEPAVRAVEQGEVRFVPDNWSHTYYEWMRNIEDWCISRQLWWGHRIPAWYDAEGRCYVAEDEAQLRRKYSLAEGFPLTQDEDVLDTWFSSALWPFSTLGWPDRSPELARYYPSAVLVTGFDIIFFWVARMIMMGIKFMGRAPFREIYIHGLVRDGTGQKMSKSKGNILDPLDLMDGIDLENLVRKRTSDLMQPQRASAIEKVTRQQFPQGISPCGADSLRFTFASLATHGRDVRFDTGRIRGYRNFCNKLWNAARYVLMNQDDTPVSGAAHALRPADRWIRTQLAQTIDETSAQLSRYRFDLAAQALYDFTWNEYCDWYLEFCKPILSAERCPAAARRVVQHTLVQVLECLLRLLHPFLPFITEELWQKVAPVLAIRGDSIMLQDWPESAQLERDPAACREMNWLKDFVMGVRKIRSGRDIASGQALAVRVRGGSPEEQEWLKNNAPLIRSLAKVSAISSAEAGAKDTVAALAGDMTILVQLADLMDRDAELARLSRILENLERERQRVRKKLDNLDFVQRAPQTVVTEAQRRLAEIISSSEKIHAQYQHMQPTKEEAE